MAYQQNKTRKRKSDREPIAWQISVRYTDRQALLADKQTRIILFALPRQQLAKLDMVVLISTFPHFTFSSMATLVSPWIKGYPLLPTFTRFVACYSLLQYVHSMLECFIRKRRQNVHRKFS